MRFGKLDIGSLTENTYGVLIATQFTCKTSGRLKFICVRLVGAGTYNARVAIYADNAGVPGDLLAQSAEQAINGPGLYGFTIAYLKIRPYTKLWLALQYDEDVAHHSYDASGSHYTRTFAYAAFPNPFGSGSAAVKTSTMFAIYAEDRPPVVK